MRFPENFLKSFTPLPQRIGRNLQASGEGTVEGTRVQTHRGMKGEEDGDRTGPPGASRGRSHDLGLKEGQGPAWAPKRACGLEEAPSQSAFLPLVSPGPFSGEKRNYVGARGFQPGPQDQRYSALGLPAWQSLGPQRNIGCFG